MNTSTRLARSLIRQLIEGGITDVVLSPGSRNSPMSIALFAAAERGLITLHVRIDERAGAFFALGIAKAGKRPVALVCTSGTAVANYHPAILEAHHSRIPLLALTADRPERLRRTGANQTTIQAGIFGEAISYMADIAEPIGNFQPILQALRNGPVHLNTQFDEPLLPDDKSDWLADAVVGIWSSEDASVAQDLVLTQARGVVVVGHDRAGFTVEEVSGFVANIGWPLIAEDPLSFPQSVAHAALFLAAEDVRRVLQPQVVIVIGRTTLSRSINSIIASAESEIAIDPRIATVDTKRDGAETFLALPHIVKQVENDPEWSSLWSSYSEKLSTMIDDLPVWSEPNIARTIAAILPERTSIFISSSRPIRDLEGFASSREGVETFANRGLAGIDGNISTALGIASQRKSTIAILGDLCFLHDMTGLIGIGDINLRILVINNDGGGIFSTLPVHGVAGFERLFGTPHGLDPAAIASAMGFTSTTVTDLKALRDALLLPIIGLSVVVARVPSREANAQELSQLKASIKPF